MLKGDLATTPLAGLLLTFAQDEVTGCLHVNSEPDEAAVYFKNGDIYAVSIPGLRSKLGAKLVSSGALTPDALADAPAQFAQDAAAFGAITSNELTDREPERGAAVPVQRRRHALTVRAGRTFR